MTNLNKYKTLIKAILNELTGTDYNELNKTFGSLTIQEIQKLSHNLHIDDVCAEFGITKAQYKKDIESYEEMYYIRKNEG